MKDKLLQQNEKKKLEKKQPRKNTEKDPPAGKENAKGVKQPRKRGENEEELMDIIEELKFELKARDQEFELMRDRVANLESSNTSLAKSLLDEKKSK